VGGTFSHFPWGKNDRRQDGPTALIDDAEPTDPLAGAQADLFGRVHLPDLMGLLGTVGVAGRAATGWRGAEAGFLEPALQGAFARDGRLGVVALQPDAQQAGAPLGVCPALGQRLVVELLRGPVPWGIGALVPGGQAIGPLVAQTAEEVTNGARGKSELLGDGGRGLALLKASPDGLA
jgi:hypothetical protein